MVAEWARSPETALRYFLAMPYEEQIALEYVINWRRLAVQKQAEEMYEQLKAQYIATKNIGND